MRVGPLGRWGHEAMGPEGHGGEVEQVRTGALKTQLRAYGRRLGPRDHGEWRGGWGWGVGVGAASLS